VEDEQVMNNARVTVRMVVKASILLFEGDSSWAERVEDINTKVDYYLRFIMSVRRATLTGHCNTTLAAR
jgi:hypothetical protein